MKKSFRIILIVLGTGVILSCSRKNNTFLNRNWHAVTAQYNALYNGNLALEQGKDAILRTYLENFWDVLPVEPMEQQEFGGLENQQEGFFSISEEKAVKAIQKHAMMIDGWERNPQIDEAYMLLGKARYYDQRFVAALEAFNFILQRYPLSNSINRARIWREKTRLRLFQEELVIDNLNEMLGEPDLKPQDRADAAATLAQAYMNIGQLDSAQVSIKEAAALTGLIEEEARYLFISGQLHNQLEEKTQANEMFSQVIEMNRRIPRQYWINAQLLLLRNQATNSPGDEEIIERLENLASDWENRNFTSRIYFEMASVYHGWGSVGAAIRYYKRSLYDNPVDPVQRSLIYQNMAQIYSEEKYYRLAATYYDSTLTYLAENSRAHWEVQRKRRHLEDVIYYENALAVSDSILHLTQLSPQEQFAFFHEYTQELERIAIEAEAASATDDSGLTPGQDQIITSGGSSFYFYNPGSVARGAQEFVRIWGNRPLADNWKISASGLPVNNQQPETAKSHEAGIKGNPLFDPQTYIARIPTRPQSLDSLRDQRALARYQLGLIYRDQFKQPLLSAKFLEDLLEQDPQHRLLVPAMYNLFRTYEKLGEESKAREMRRQILSRYPHSHYALLIERQGDDSASMALEREVYEKLVSLFEDQKFEEVIAGVEDYSDERYYAPRAAQFRMLRARALGRLLGLEAYRQALNEVALDYPQSDQGKEAEELIREAIPRLTQLTYEPEAATEAYKIVFRFNKGQEETINDFKEILDKLIEEGDVSQLETSIDVYNLQEVFVVVHGLEGRLAGEQLFLNLNKTLKPENYFYISASNYRILQIQKNLETYLN